MRRLTKTFELIERLRPMIPHYKLDEYENEHGIGLGKFDVGFKQEDDLDTIWGKSQLNYTSTDLRSLANDIYDYVHDGYQVWIRETPEFENGQSSISDDSLRYVISLEADNMDEEMIPLDCRIVSGWLVLSAVFDASKSDVKKFFDEFGYGDKKTW